MYTEYGEIHMVEAFNDVILIKFINNLLLHSVQYYLYKTRIANSDIIYI